MYVYVYVCSGGTQSIARMYVYVVGEVSQSIASIHRLTHARSIYRPYLACAEVHDRAQVDLGLSLHDMFVCMYVHHVR